MNCCVGCQSGMGCCSGFGLSGLYGLDNLMGDLSLPPVKKGARFQFGYNVGYLGEGFIASGVGETLNQSGLTDSAVSYQIAGMLNPFIAVEGKSNRDWNSGTDFRDAIYNAINGAGYPIEPSSIQFNVETVSGGYTAPPVSSTRPPGTSGRSIGTSFWDEIAAGLGVPKGTAQAIGLGVGAILLILIAKK
jgi:hypothetical protein